MKQTVKAMILTAAAAVIMTGCEFIEGTTSNVMNAAMYTTPLCSDAALKSLSVEGFDISPEFSPDTLEYSLVVNKSATTSLTVRAIGPKSAAVLINGTASVEPAFSADIALDSGLDVNDVSVSVTAQDGVTASLYKLHVYYLGTNASLSGLTVAKTSGSGGVITADLNPAFSPTQMTYTVGISYYVSSLDFTITMPEAGMTASIDGWTALSGVSVPITNLPGASGSRTVPIIVKSQDGGTTKTYNVTINKGPAPSSNALLTSLKLYNNRRIIGIEWGWYEEALTPSPTVANLATLTSFGAQFTSSQPIHFYVTFTTASSVVSGVKVNGTTVTPSGGLYTSPTLTGPGSGDFFINIEVTAEDGVTKKTYIVTASVL